MLKINTSKRIYLLIAFLVIIGKTVLEIFPVEHPIVHMFLLNWEWLILILVAGYFVLILAGYAGFPKLLDDSVAPKKRIVLPLAFGAACAVLQVIFCIYLEFPNFNVPFPHSVPAYFSFGTLYEILFHLIPVVLLTWLVSTVLLRGKYGNQTFLVIAVLLSLFEPYTQINGLVAAGIISGIWIIAFFTVLIFLANIIPLVLFRRYGFLSMILFRYTDYLLWHIVWPLIYYPV